MRLKTERRIEISKSPDLTYFFRMTGFRNRTSIDNIYNNIYISHHRIADNAKSQIQQGIQDSMLNSLLISVALSPSLSQ